MDSVPSESTDIEDPSLGVDFEFIPSSPYDVEDTLLGAAVDCSLSIPSDLVDPSLGLTDGGLLGRGVPSKASLVVFVDVVDRSFFMEGGR